LVADTATFRTGGSVSAASSVWLGFAVATDPERFGASGVPSSIPSDQAYYWSVPWQADIRESMNALAAGEFEDFESDVPNDVARWLLGGDDD
jgi:hypothetical protein